MQLILGFFLATTPVDDLFASVTADIAGLITPYNLLITGCVVFLVIGIGIKLLKRGASKV